MVYIKYSFQEFGGSQVSTAEIVNKYKLDSKCKNLEMCPDWQVLISKDSLPSSKKKFYYYYWNFEGKFEFLMNAKIHGHKLTRRVQVLPGFEKVYFSMKKLLK